MATRQLLTKIGLVLCVISLVVQALGFTCPGWVYTTIYLHLIGAILGADITGFGELTTMAAVWYGQVCLEADYMDSVSCSLDTTHNARLYGYRVTTALTPLADIDWTLVKVCLTLALCMCLTGTLLTALSLCNTRISPRLSAVVAAACMLVSGGLVIPAAVEVSLSLYDAEQNVSRLTASTGYELVIIKAPWALILSCIGVTVAFAGAIVLVIAACKEKQKKLLEISPDSSKILFDIKATDTKVVEVSDEIDEDFFRNVYPEINKDRNTPRIGEPDNEPLVFENMPFRGAFATGTEQTTHQKESIPTVDSQVSLANKLTTNYKRKSVTRETKDASRIKHPRCASQRWSSASYNSNAKNVSEDLDSSRPSTDGKQVTSYTPVNGNDGIKKVHTYYTNINHGEARKEPAKGVNTYYSSLATEGVPAARPLPAQKQKGHASKKESEGSNYGIKTDNGSKSSRKSSQETDLDPFTRGERKQSLDSGLDSFEDIQKEPDRNKRKQIVSVIAVSPYVNAKPNANPTTGVVEKKKRALTKTEKTLLDLSTIYGQKLTHGTKKKDGQASRNTTVVAKPERNGSQNTTRECSVVSW